MRPRWLTLAAQRPFACGLASSLLMYASLPPLGWSWLTWLAPLGWLLQARDGQATGRRFYLPQWLAACVFFLAFLHGIRLAYPALYLGWFALSAYLAIYPPLFIALTRWATRRAHCPLLIAAPVIWVSGELLRGYLLTGFTGGMLGHGLAFWTTTIQLADIGGAYGVSGLVMLVATALLQQLPTTSPELAADQPPECNPQRGIKPWCDRPMGSALSAALAVLAALTYGHLRQQQVDQQVGPQQRSSATQTAAVEESPRRSATAADGLSTSDSLHIALIQNSIDTVFDYNEERNRQTFERYREQTLEVCRTHPDLDVVIWPESMFTENSPEFLVEDPELRVRIADRLRAFEAKVRLLAREIAEIRGDEGLHLVVGTITIDATHSDRRPREYNSALLIHPSGEVVDRYYKQHLVMFGEYIPLGETFPQLYQWVGMGGATPGDRPVAFAVKDHKLCPNICFETMVPHVIGSQLRELRKSEKVADILINLTNDGWFWGSTILDMHFQAGIFRAIEARKPLVVAANTGITAWIDGSGRVIDQLPRRQPGVLIARVTSDGRRSWYERWGDRPVVGLVILFYGWLAVRHRRVPKGSVERRSEGSS